MISTFHLLLNAPLVGLQIKAALTRTSGVACVYFAILHVPLFEVTLPILAAWLIANPILYKFLFRKSHYQWGFGWGALCPALHLRDTRHEPCLILAAARFR
jgi:hypothetical protein